MTEKSDRIIGLTNSGLYTNMTCVAEAAHVSREYVRLVLNAKGGFEDFGPRGGFRLRWTCPDCGGLIELTPSQLNRRTHMLAHCRSCAANYCHSGRHNMVITGRASKGGCKLCLREYLIHTVEIKTCEHCGEPLEISRVMLQMIRNPNQKAKGKYHRKCYLEIVGKINGTPTHCRRNHEFTEENTYRWGGKRFCRVCIRRRGRKAYRKNKAVV